MRLILIAAILSVGCTSSAPLTVSSASATAAEQEPDATAPGNDAADAPACATNEVFREMASMYAGLASYADTGEVVTIFEDADGRRHGSRKPFRTAFVRPDRFRFEFTEQENEFATQDRYVIWSDDGSTRNWWTANPDVVRESPSIDRAYWAAAGVSGGSSSVVPTMLLASREYPVALHLLRQARLDGREDVDGVPCFRLVWTEAEHSLPNHPVEPLPDAGIPQSPTEAAAEAVTESLTAWIAVQDLAFRRLVDRTRFSDFRSEHTITWRPTLNAEIDPAEFAFDPPSTGDPGDAD